MNRKQRRAAARMGIVQAPARPLIGGAVSTTDLQSEEAVEKLFAWALERHQAKSTLDEVYEKMLSDVRSKFYAHEDELAKLILEEVWAAEDHAAAVYFIAFARAVNKAYGYKAGIKKILDEVPALIDEVSEDPEYWFYKINDEYKLGLATDVFDGDENFLKRIKNYAKGRIPCIKL